MMMINRDFEVSINIKQCKSYQTHMWNIYKQTLLMLSTGDTADNAVNEEYASKIVKRLYAEIKSQIFRKDHPLQIVNRAFRRHFTRYYRKYVVKEKDSKVGNMLKRIEKATIRLRESESSSEMFSSDETDDIRFSDKVLGDVKRIIAVLLFTIIRFY